mmetsp:Transcript_17367/g.21035  ORF Transcript_17367/g.21035 Transcript_17367/m.21035 type:complete len:89 (-) Transcript_17367:7-273(-)
MNVNVNVQTNPLRTSTRALYLNQAQAHIFIFTLYTLSEAHPEPPQVVDSVNVKVYLLTLCPPVYKVSYFNRIIISLEMLYLVFSYSSV